MKKALTYDDVIPFLMKHKPSQLQQHVREKMSWGIDKEKDVFIEKALKHIPSDYLIRAYDDLSK